MDKKPQASKTIPSNKATTEKPQTQNKDNSKQTQSKNATQKKETTRLNPVKPKGKTNEAEKKTLRQARESLPRNNTRVGAGGKNAKKEKKEVEKELYLRFGKRVLNYREEEQDLDDTTFLRYNVIGILFTGSWVPPAKEFMEKLEALYAEINKTEKILK